MKNTQTQQILDLLKAGQSITPLGALELFGCFRLASRISEIKKMGYNVVSERIQDGKKHYSRYYLFCK